MPLPIELRGGQINERFIRKADVTPELLNFPCCYTIIDVARTATEKKTGKQTKGQRRFITSIAEITLEKSARFIRLRWNIENKNHNPRDATFREDDSRCRTGNTVANLALLRGVCLCIWRKHATKLPATAFIQKNLTKKDETIAIINKL